MKTLWTILSVLAVANLIALIGIGGWLGASKRLDMVRMREVRHLLSETSAQRIAREDAERAKAADEKRVAAERASAQVTPIGAEGALQLKLDESQADQARVEGLRREVQIMQETLRRERRALDDERAALEKAKADFEEARRQVAQTEGNAQFKKTLATYEGLKPDKAKTALQTLIAGQQTAQVVAYLNAMQERTRTKIIDEFIKDDPKVATDLLERIRTRGMLPSGPEGSS
jgi:hypothetical protein